MNTTIDFLEAVKAKTGIASDYALAKKLEVSQQAVSRYRLKQCAMEDYVCLRVANILEIDPATVLACVHAERSKTDAEKSAWKLIYERLGGVAASLLIATLLLPAIPTPARAAGSVVPDNVYYVKLMKVKNRLLLQV